MRLWLLIAVERRKVDIPPAMPKVRLVGDESEAKDRQNCPVCRNSAQREYDEATRAD